MFEPTVLGRNYDAAFEAIKESLNSLQRETSAAILADYPDRGSLCAVAEELRQELDTESVLINVVFHGEQMTILTQPTGSTVSFTIPDTDSMCALVVGADMPLAVRDTKKSPVSAGGYTSSICDAWAAAPIHIYGHAAGTICATDDKPRDWNIEHERKLMRVARHIGRVVEDWADNQSK